MPKPLLALRTFAVAVIVMVTGAGPQSKVMMPPAATAFTTAAEVQLAGVPVPTLRDGWLVSTAFACKHAARSEAVKLVWGESSGDRLAERSPSPMC